MLSFVTRVSRDLSVENAGVQMKMPVCKTIFEGCELGAWGSREKSLQPKKACSPMNGEQAFVRCASGASGSFEP
ncbi:MAG: hypothetical protein CBE00_10985 [Planctomycetaceae bacterium TMED240]|nr:hypothetical protein [Rhodopirellula sp.]OUX05289.1 MAG: hypothetical protein CBE00_10985 [Planctomycetaceae bacterium TMED240]